jgi:hypothetical protein
VDFLNFSTKWKLVFIVKPRSLYCRKKIPGARSIEVLRGHRLYGTKKYIFRARIENILKTVRNIITILPETSELSHYCASQVFYVRKLRGPAYLKACSCHQVHLLTNNNISAYVTRTKLYCVATTSTLPEIPYLYSNINTKIVPFI